MAAFPQIAWERNRIWIWDATHFTRCKRVAYAIVDVVTRYWIGYLVSSEQTSTQAQLLFARALPVHLKYTRGYLRPQALLRFVTAEIAVLRRGGPAQHGRD